MQSMACQQRHVWRRLVGSCNPLRHSGRPMLCMQSGPPSRFQGVLKFSTSADKKSDKHNGNDHDDDKSMMEKVKETVHAGVDKSYEQLQKLKSGLESIDEKLLGDDGVVDKAKEKLHAGIDKSHEQFDKLKKGLDSQNDKVRAMASKYFDSVKDNATNVQDMLKDYEDNTTEMGMDYYERVRDSLDKWNESLLDLETKASEFSGSFGKDISDYVKQQRKEHAELTRKAKGRKQKKRD
ncbi:hypothetical protein AaE_011456 [Aphanomyces astaci]|uniref:Uncharacterized protein n=1 Tax=Aphanomyces astaci TaxID=112090 RepID=A0A6A4ZWF5_APHAT|nr:hypothetical protein AaE_011456 [Aphanomyces astaci]